jgi:tetratricopeptide (TPR) repeat protein
MSQENVQQWVAQAIQRARSGDRAGARQAFIAALRLDPRDETALVGLAALVDGEKERLALLKQAYSFYPQSPKVLEAMRRLNIGPDDLNPPLVPPAPSPAPRPIQRITGEQPAVPQAASAPPAGGIKRLTGTMAAVPPTPAQQTPQNPPADEPASEPAAQSPAAPPAFDDVINRLLVVPSGDSGTPIPDLGRLQKTTQAANALVAQFQHTRDTAESPLAWALKDSKRAGEGDIRVLQARVAGVAAVVSLFLGTLVLLLALNNPDVQRIVFAATWTQSPTPTNTATPTPGVTPTASATPEVTLTPSPTLPPQFATANPLVQPRATRVYLPAGLALEPRIEQAVELINTGRYASARTILEQEKTAGELTGNFIPYYYLVDLYVRQGNLTQASAENVAGDALWQERSAREAYKPLIDISYARVALAELAALRASGVRPPNQSEILNAVDERIEAALSFDAANPDAWLLRVERHLLANDRDNALAALEEALALPNLADNTSLRTRRAELLIQQGRTAEALHYLQETLLLNPYAEAALILQVRAALGENLPGLAVLYAEQYMARYPGRVLAVKLRGDAWLAEGKLDLALQNYDRALTGDPADPAFTETLIARANVYQRLGDAEKALTDLTEAFRLSEDPRVRFTRMEAAYAAGNLTLARADAAALANDSTIPREALALMNARLSLADGDLDAAVTLLSPLAAEGDAAAAELLARVYLEQGAVANALTTVNRALAAGQTVERHLLRAQIHEAAAQRASDADRPRSLRQALFDYDWALTFAGYTLPEAELAALRAAAARVREALASAAS